ncbi:hypothetical protein PQI23_08425 [Leucobacter sp. USCH14]|uniref:hypothetical protein n=1 Tax=Leucobacter sp. USCH14 TaxID=3024838 RepID=UPI0030B1636F
MHSAPEHMTHAERAAMGCTAGDQGRTGQAVARASSDAADRRPRVVGRRAAFNLLAYVAAYDSRERGEGEAVAWSDALGPYRIPVEDAQAAVRAYFLGPNRHRWITPGDIVELVEEGVQS